MQTFESYFVVLTKGADSDSVESRTFGRTRTRTFYWSHESEVAKNLRKILEYQKHLIWIITQIIIDFGDLMRQLPLEVNNNSLKAENK